MQVTEESEPQEMKSHMIQSIREAAEQTVTDHAKQVVLQAAAVIESLQREVLSLRREVAAMHSERQALFEQETSISCDFDR